MQKIVPCLWFDDRIDAAMEFYMSLFPGRSGHGGHALRRGRAAAGGEKLCAGGEEQQCGWVTDRYGLSWQVVPDALTRLMTGGEAAANRVMAVILGMRKLEIAALERAWAGA